MCLKKIIVIPARMASTRFPNKPLALIQGVPMIERVWRIAQAVTGVDQIYIATDDKSLQEFVASLGASVLMTSSSCLTGMDRVAEVAQILGHPDAIFFNLQGDAVLTPPWIIQSVIEEMASDPSVQIATPAVLLTGEALHQFVQDKRQGSSSGTAVVFDRHKNALYFSKALLPYQREGTANIYRHIGLYGYRQKALLELSSLPEGPLEKAEKLEQLRALENSIPIRVVEVDYRGRTHGSVDRPEDVHFVESILRSEGELLQCSRSKLF